MKLCVETTMMMMTTPTMAEDPPTTTSMGINRNYRVFDKQYYQVYKDTHVRHVVCIVALDRKGNGKSSILKEHFFYTDL